MVSGETDEGGIHYLSRRGTRGGTIIGPLMNLFFLDVNKNYVTTFEWKIQNINNPNRNGRCYFQYFILGYSIVFLYFVILYSLF